MNPHPLRLLLATAASLAACALLADEPRPNIVFLLADDLGWSDLACYGSEFYLTPNIDRLAAQGMKFTDGYSCGPNCQPTRAALLSGQYGPRTGIYTVGGIGRFHWQSRPLRPVDNVEALRGDKVTVAQALRDAGYATACIGKWHLGAKAHPLDRGFDQFFGFLGGAHDYFKDKGILRDREPVKEPEYLTDAFGREAEDFIRRHRAQPFFLYLAFNAVHTPLEAPPAAMERYNGRAPAGGQKSPVYGGMLSRLDDRVGRVLALLDELKLSDHTLVIFSSDNGGVGGYRREGIEAQDITDNAPLRGGKGMLYEGGVRVPFIFRWPGHIAPGSTCATPINSVDLYPTLLELARAPRPKGYVLDGTSYLGLLRGKPAGERPPLYWHFPGYLGAGGHTWRTLPGGAIRDGDWKLIEFFEDGRTELYNLRDDIGQRHDLARRETDRAVALRRQLADWRARVDAPMPAPNRHREPARDLEKNVEATEE